MKEPEGPSESIEEMEFTRRKAIHAVLSFVIGLVILLAACMETIVQYPDQSLASLARGVGHRHAQTLTLMVLICPFFIYRSVKFSHRFAGPIWRLRREIRALNDGGPIAPVRFRKGDFWEDLADDFNGVLSRLARAEQQQSDTSEQLDGHGILSAEVAHDLAAK